MSLPLTRAHDLRLQDFIRMLSWFFMIWLHHDIIMEAAILRELWSDCLVARIRIPLLWNISALFSLLQIRVNMIWAAFSLLWNVTRQHWSSWILLFHFLHCRVKHSLRRSWYWEITCRSSDVSLEKASASWRLNFWKMSILSINVNNSKEFKTLMQSTQPGWQLRAYHNYFVVFFSHLDITLTTLTSSEKTSNPSQKSSYPRIK